VPEQEVHHLGIVVALHKELPDPTAAEGSVDLNGWSLLHHAAKQVWQSEECVTIHNSDGTEEVHHYPPSRQYHHMGADPDILRFFVECAKVPINRTNITGATALHIAACNEQNNVVLPNGGILKLVELGADVNALDGDKRTPLMFAAGMDRTGLVVAQLIVCGADCFARDQYGKTPLNYALEESMSRNMEILSKARKQYASGSFDHWKDQLIEHVAQQNVDEQAATF